MILRSDTGRFLDVPLMCSFRGIDGATDAIEAM